MIAAEQLAITESDIRDWLGIAYQAALASPDPSTQNGGILFDAQRRMIGHGHNGFTRGMPITKDLLERPKKYVYIEHAERNTLFGALAFGSGPPDILVVPWAACADCARAIVQCGVKTLIRHRREDTTGRWDSIIDGDIIMRAGGVNIIEYTENLGCPPILFNGEMYYP